MRSQQEPLDQLSEGRLLLQAGDNDAAIARFDEFVQGIRGTFPYHDLTRSEEFSHRQLI